MSNSIPVGIQETMVHWNYVLYFQVLTLGDLFVDTPFSLAAVLPFKLNLFEVIWLHLRQITVMSE